MGIQYNLKICDSSYIFRPHSSPGSEIPHGTIGGFCLKP